MNRNPAATSYLRTRVLTASSQELRLMLYEGAIKFSRQAAEAIASSDIEASYHALMRSQKIVLELSTSLNHQVAPDLCQQLAAIYRFIYRQLVDASVNRDKAAVDDAVRLLEYEKQTWQMLMQQTAPTSDRDMPDRVALDADRQHEGGRFSASA